MNALQPDRLDFDHKDSDSFGDGEVQCKVHHTLWLACAQKISTNLASLATLVHCIRIAIGVEGLHSRGKDWVQVQYSRVTLCIVNGVRRPINGEELIVSEHWHGPSITDKLDRIKLSKHERRAIAGDDPDICSTTAARISAIVQLKGATFKYYDRNVAGGGQFDTLSHDGKANLQAEYNNISAIVEFPQLHYFGINQPIYEVNFPKLNESLRRQDIGVSACFTLSEIQPGQFIDESAGFVNHFPHGQVQAPPLALGIAQPEPELAVDQAVFERAVGVRVTPSVPPPSVPPPPTSEPPALLGESAYVLPGKRPLSDDGSTASFSLSDLVNFSLGDKDFCPFSDDSDFTKEEYINEDACVDEQVNLAKRRKVPADVAKPAVAAPAVAQPEAEKPVEEEVPTGIPISELPITSARNPALIYDLRHSRNKTSFSCSNLGKGKYEVNIFDNDDGWAVTFNSCKPVLADHLKYSEDCEECVSAIRTLLASTFDTLLICTKFKARSGDIYSKGTNSNPSRIVSANLDTPFKPGTAGARRQQTLRATILAYSYEALRDTLTERILTPFEDYKQSVTTRLARAIGPSANAKQIAADFRGV